ncbi:MAG: iron-sulfur cluster assembly accessory protein [Gammaproteobacteria bacterium]|nr:iron-sulfur cluster assembly accessory protein [Gammaproteobacteria bacterium]
MAPNNQNQNQDQKPDQKLVTLTSAAAEHISAEINKANKTGEVILGLKFGVKKSGCSGFAYFIDFVKKTELNHIDNNSITPYQVSISHGINIYIDPASYEIVAGTEIDYVKKGIGSVMVFRNPNSTAECGCGESFTVSNEK